MNPIATVFSIIIPIYNASAYLPACLDSVLGQTCSDFELILVDDGSTDGSGAVCDAYAAKDSRIAVVHQSGGGVVRARRAGLDRASGEYICFVDADDSVDPDWLETVRRRIGENGAPDMLIFGHVRDSGDGRLLERRPPEAPAGLYDKARLQAEIYPHMLYDRRYEFFTPLVSGFLWMKIAKRALYDACYIRDDRIRLLEDVSMIYECLYRADTVYVGTECPYHYRIHDEATQSRYHEDYMDQMKLCVDYLRSHLGALDPVLDRQIDAFAAARTISAVTHDLRHGRSVPFTARHIRRGLRETAILKGLSIRNTPLLIRCYVGLLRAGLCYAATLIALIRLHLSEGSHIRARM